MCGATAGGLSLEGIDVTKETVIQGVVSRDGQPVGGAYVRLLDGTGEFTAEVPTSAAGQSSLHQATGPCAPWLQERRSIALWSPRKVKFLRLR